MRQKCQKTEFFGGHLGFLAAILNFRFGSEQNSKALGLPQVFLKVTAYSENLQKNAKKQLFQPPL